MPAIEVTRPLKLSPTGGSVLTIVNKGPAGIYYGRNSKVSATENIGTLASGENLALTKGFVWVVAVPATGKEVQLTAIVDLEEAEIVGTLERGEAKQIAEEVTTEFAARPVAPEAASVVATENIASLTGIPSKTLTDEVTLLEGQIVLLAGQTNKVRNGPWVVMSAAWVRPTWFAAGTQHWGSLIPIVEGTIHHGETWILANGVTVQAESTPLTWESNSANSTALGPGSVTTSFIANGAVTAPKVGPEVDTTIEKVLTATAEEVKLNLAEANYFVVLLEVGKVKFVVENIPTTRPAGFTLQLEWTATGGATTFTVETVAKTKMVWEGGIEPSFLRTAKARGFVGVLTFSKGAELLGLVGGITAAEKVIEERITKAQLEKENTGLGTNALEKGEEAKGRNVGIGYQAAHFLTKGTKNTLLGWETGNEITTGSNNVGVGASALGGIKTASGNTAVGTSALENVTGANNVALGFSAGATTNSGHNNVLLGYEAGFAVTTGVGSVAIGYQALLTNKAGEGNIAIGAFALGKATEGESTAVGQAALGICSTGFGNVALGAYALTTIVAEGACTAIGSKALEKATGGSNTALGYSAGKAITTGEKNVLLGVEAGAALTTSSNQLYVANSNTAEPLIKGVFPNAELTFNTAKIALYKGVTPVSRHVTIAVPAETTAANTKAIKELIEATKGIGIIE